MQGVFPIWGIICYFSCMLIHGIRVFALIAVVCSFCCCSNSDCVDYINSDTFFANTELGKPTLAEDGTPCFPLNDYKHPYAGIPRIVIETEKRQAIDNKEIEIPAKLQVWGECGAESDVMELTIKGRGNSTWGSPKKPYTIKFKEKQAFLGMPAAKKWVMLANYRDRTLMRNAVAFELAKRTSLAWTPSGQFVDVFLNGVFMGNYYISEKIEVKKNRLEVGENGFLLEFDPNIDEGRNFKTKYNKLPVNIKYPKDLDSESFNYIRDYMDSVESILLQPQDSVYLDYVNPESVADYYIVYALTTNIELCTPKSAFVYRDDTGLLNAGPVWDFDYSTFKMELSVGINSGVPFLNAFFRKPSFIKVLNERWAASKERFLAMDSFIDSLSNYISQSNEQNVKLWPINIEEDLVGDEKMSFPDAVDNMKRTLQAKIAELDSLMLAIWN